MLHYARLERLASDNHFGLLDPFISYEENKVLWICHNDTKRNDIQKNHTQHKKYCTQQMMLSIMTVFTKCGYAECRLCFIVMLSHVNNRCRLCSVSFILGVVYAESRLCWVSFMLSIIYAECCLCWMYCMLSVMYDKCRLWWVSFMCSNAFV